MKYYILIVEDKYKNSCCGSNLSELSSLILNSVTNGFVQLTPFSFIFKSLQNKKYWQDLIMSKIDKNKNEFFISTIDINNTAGYIRTDVWTWINSDKAEIEKSLCKNTFEVESCC